VAPTTAITLATAVAYTFTKSHYKNTLGISLDGGKDINGDGKPDLLIGDPVATESNEGVGYALLGPFDALAPTAAPSATPTALPSAAPTVKPTVRRTVAPTAPPTTAEQQDYEVVLHIDQVLCQRIVSPCYFIVDEVRLMFLQTVSGVAAADYDDAQAAYNLTIQHTLAASMDGVSPDAVTDIVVTDAARSAVQRDEHPPALASAADSCRLSYTITVHDPLLTYDVLRDQLIEAASSGAMDENLHKYATEFGADDLADCTCGTPEVRNAADKERSDKNKLRAGGIAGLVIGNFAGACLIVGMVWCCVKRGNQQHEVKVSTWTLLLCHSDILNFCVPHSGRFTPPPTLKRLRDRQWGLFHASNLIIRAD
jgi:hypothetical protein